MTAKDVTVLIPHRRGNSEEWLRQALSGFPKDVTVLVAENDGEMAEALNVALAQVATPWVCVFNDDDVPLRGFLQEMLAVSFDADVVYPSMVSVSEDLKEIKAEHPAWPFCGNRLEFMNFVPGLFLARTETLRKVGGWRDLDTLEDWDLHVRMYHAGARFKPAHRAVALYRRRVSTRNAAHAGSTSQTRESMFSFRDTHIGPHTIPVAHFHYQATVATTYLRCQLPARFLPGRCTQDMWFNHNEDGKIIDSDWEARDIVLQYPGDMARSMMLVVAQANGYRVWVEVDDDYLNAERKFMEKALWSRTISEGHVGTGFSQQGHRWLVEHAHGVIVTNRVLADRYRKINPNVVVAPNCVDEDDWTVLKPVREDDSFRVGWAASQSHLGDERVIHRALEWAAQRRDGLVLLMGNITPSWKFTWVQVPWTDDLSVYRLNLHQLDVGLCPITRSLQGTARSDIKASEYAMAGALPIVHDAEPYEDWTHMENCLKAQSSTDYLNQVKWAMSHRDEAKQLAAEAKKWVMLNRNIRNQVGVWREAFETGGEHAGEVTSPAEVGVRGEGGEVGAGASHG